MENWSNIHVKNGYDHDAYTYYPVLIVGAGESGIAMGCQLKLRLGFDQFRIFDRQSGLGGTWWINRYPGVRCDVPSAFYSFSWEPYYTAPELYPDGASIVKYLHRVAAKYHLHDKIQLNTDISECTWSDAEQLWTCRLTYLVHGAGDLSAKDRKEKVETGGETAVYLKTEIVKAKVVISCVGGLVEPKSLPENIPGLESFKGDLFHAARWRHDIDLTGKDVVVIGTGCSAAQVVPAVLEEPYKIKSLTQLMRTPPWCVPKMPEPGGKVAYARNAPTIFKYNPWLGWLLRQTIASTAEQDWFYMFKNTKLANNFRKKHGDEMVARMKKYAPKEYHEMLTPDYDIGCKRRVFDTEWYRCMHNPKFHLTTQKMVGIVPDGVKVGPGRWYPAKSTDDNAPTTEEVIKADVIVLANGYETTNFLHPLKVTGRGGREIHDVWEERGGPQAYLGTAMDGFPNFFMIYGPNIVTGHSSVIMQTENGVRYVVNMLGPILKGDADLVEVKEEAERAYTAQAQRDSKKTVFLEGGCGSWYIDPKTGWNATTYPRSQIDYWWRCKYPVWSHWNYNYTSKGLAKRGLHKTLRFGLLVAALASVYWARKTGASPVQVARRTLLGAVLTVLQSVQLGLGLAQDKISTIV